MYKELTPLDYFIALGQTCLMQSRNYKNNEVVVLKNGEKHTTKELGDIVVTALERLEELEIENSEQFKEKWVQDNLAMTFELNVANKKLKVLEIIKEKRVAVNILLMSEDAYVYNELYEAVIIPNGVKAKYDYELSQNEFDLLKEVLL